MINVKIPTTKVLLNDNLTKIIEVIKVVYQDQI